MIHFLIIFNDIPNSYFKFNKLKFYMTNMRNLRIWVPNRNKIAILMAHQYPVKMNTSQKTALKLDEK